MRTPPRAAAVLLLLGCPAFGRAEDAPRVAFVAGEKGYVVVLPRAAAERLRDALAGRVDEDAVAGALKAASDAGAVPPDLKAAAAELAAMWRANAARFKDALDQGMGPNGVEIEVGKGRWAGPPVRAVVGSRLPESTRPYGRAILALAPRRVRAVAETPVTLPLNPGDWTVKPRE